MFLPEARTQPESKQELAGDHRGKYDPFGSPHAVGDLVVPL
jgi:hypothetical protein